MLLFAVALASLEITIGLESLMILVKSYAPSRLVHGDGLDFLEASNIQTLRCYSSAVPSFTHKTDRID